MFPFATIHQQTIDDFYFNEVIAQMHPILQTLAADGRVLRHYPEPTPVTSFTQVYAPDYLVLSWIMDDIFPASETEHTLITRAYLMVFVAYILLDHLVDGQISHIPAVPLIHQHLLITGQEYFARVFDFKSPFWPVYYANMRQMANMLTVETYHVDEQQQPYSEALMKEVAAGKAVAWRNLVYALALVSDKIDLVPAMNEVFNALALADQYGDDASDWREDFAVKRATLPTVMVAQAEQVSLTEVFDLDPEHLENRMIKEGIFLYLCDKGIETLQLARSQLAAVGLENTKLDQFLVYRIEQEQLRRRNFSAISLVRGLFQSLSGKK